MPTRLQLKSESREGLDAKILSSYPGGTRVVEIEKVTQGGIGGLFARTFFEAVIEVPDPAPASRHQTAFPSLAADLSKASTAHPVPPRAGVAALLADADSAEAAMHGTPAAAPVPEMSTSTRSFDDLMDSLDRSTLAVPGQEGRLAPVPVPLNHPGDAVMIVGLGANALSTARSMAAAAGVSTLRTAGSHRAGDVEHLVGRQGLVAARAAAVLAGEPLFVAFGLGTDGSVRANTLTELKADQVWIVVDATAKPADTAAWVRKVGWSANITAMAVTGSQDTLTPATVNDLDVPIGWLDGRKAPRSAL